jgi:hypothetical protein
VAGAAGMVGGEVMTAVRVLVAQTFVGVWARFVGVNPRGEPRTVVGAVVGGPDVVDTDLPAGRMLALLLRDYSTTGDGRDRLLFADVDAYAELVGEPLDEHTEASMVAHTAAPVLPGMAAEVRLERWTPPTRPGGRGWWKREVHYDVPAERLAEWETGPTRLVGVWWHPSPVPGEILASAGAVRVGSAGRLLDPWAAVVDGLIATVTS